MPYRATLPVRSKRGAVHNVNQILAYLGGGATVASTNFGVATQQIRVVSEVQGWLSIGASTTVTVGSNGLKISANVFHLNLNRLRLDWGGGVRQRDTSLKYVGGKPGYCYSACATAFLGGEFRYWTEGSIYGVHRFFWKSQSTDDAALAQIMSAALVEYIRSMGVDTKIFALASQAGSNELITPAHDVLLALNVVNDGRKPPKWTIESIPQGIYLKGEQETANGVNKFMLGCPPGVSTMVLYAIFEGGENAERDIRWSINRLFLDHSGIRINKQLYSKDIKDGKINLVYRLNSNLIAAISRARFVGVGLQPTPEAKVFLGFDSMPFEEGAIKMPGLTSMCGWQRNRSETGRSPGGQ